MSKHVIYKTLNSVEETGIGLKKTAIGLQLAPSPALINQPNLVTWLFI